MLTHQWGAGDSSDAPHRKMKHPLPLSYRNIPGKFEVFTGTDPFVRYGVGSRRMLAEVPQAPSRSYTAEGRSIHRGNTPFQRVVLSTVTCGSEHKITDQQAVAGISNGERPKTFSLILQARKTYNGQSTTSF